MLASGSLLSIIELYIAMSRVKKTSSFLAVDVALIGESACIIHPYAFIATQKVTNISNAGQELSLDRDHTARYFVSLS
jgi:hypothetical protein